VHDDAFLFTTQLLDYYNDTGYVSSAGFVTDFWCDNVSDQDLVFASQLAEQVNSTISDSDAMPHASFLWSLWCCF